MASSMAANSPLSSIDVNAWLGDVSPAVIIVGLIVFGLPTMIASINGVLAIIKHFRKDPPAHEVFATKVELSAVEQRLANQLKTHAAQSEALEQRLTRQLEQGERLFQSIQKELGDVAERTAELRGVVSTLRETIASLKTRRSS
jgi:hypothetical protein